MIAVIFEVEPKAGCGQKYLDIAADLRQRVAGIDGFIGIERFVSLAQSGRYLSLSYWRDEAAVRAWRADAEHRSAQERGRAQLFADYRLRIAHVIRDYGMTDRRQARAQE